MSISMQKSRPARFTRMDKRISYISTLAMILSLAVNFGYGFLYSFENTPWGVAVTGAVFEGIFTTGLQFLFYREARRERLREETEPDNGKAPDWPEQGEGCSKAAKILIGIGGMIQIVIRPLTERYISLRFSGLLFLVWVAVAGASYWLGYHESAKRCG